MTMTGMISDSMCGPSQIANQDLAALQKDAGESVKLTGDVNADTIKVSKVALAKK